MTSPLRENLVEVVRSAGVVGAGGAGFPTYLKIDTRADIVIANGAECEPLLFKDQVLMEHHAAEILDGMSVLMRHVGAADGIVAVKGKNRKAVEALSRQLPDNVRLFEMEDVYPAGDEYEVVYHATGRRIPVGGYPTQIGVVVQNVETLYNMHRAVQGQPVTHSMMTVHGDVNRPFTAWLPIGMRYGDVLQFAGGPAIDDFVLIDGGPMMGSVTSNLSTPVTRVSSGITVVARESNLATRKAQSERAQKRIGKSACDQCRLCTEMCPRYLLGYPIQPHLVMRSLQLSGASSDALSPWARACSECNVCTLWACPEGLDPRGICVAARAESQRTPDGTSSLEPASEMRDVHPLKDFRGVPTERLTRRLGLQRFHEQAPLLNLEVEPVSVTIPLSQHPGAPALPLVAAGDRVASGDLIARAAESGQSVPVHASMEGTVESVSEVVVIRRSD